eukprot:TRINITY_DN68027_c11_g4_i2.p1 TRINITY_DN68027_c11_g4~~TRINITY_DN68027_c11_g4_i2.p1  ORF type:complete len:255 (+),score=6.12 TRINITY_DN68027_c11_g4_i2:30-767(+)
MHGRESSPPLPPGWDKGYTAQGKVYYLHHATKTTQWKDPRNSGGVPQSEDRYSSAGGGGGGGRGGYDSGRGRDWEASDRGYGGGGYGGPQRTSRAPLRDSKPYDPHMYRRERAYSPRPLLHGPVQARIDSLVDANLIGRGDLSQDTLERLADLFDPQVGCKVLDDFVGAVRNLGRGERCAALPFVDKPSPRYFVFVSVSRFVPAIRILSGTRPYTCAGVGEPAVDVTSTLGHGRSKGEWECSGNC